jgi:hypothetical protein
MFLLMNSVYELRVSFHPYAISIIRVVYLKIRGTSLAIFMQICYDNHDNKSCFACW